MTKFDLSVDAVIFGFDANELSVLLIKRKAEPFKGKWALPGGFVEEDELLHDAAKRELEEETGIRVSHLHQVYVFDGIERDPRKRVISVAHVGLVKKSLHQPKANDDAEQAQWFLLKKLPELAFDHHEIISKAIQKILSKLDLEFVDMESEFSEDELKQVRKELSIL